MHSKPLKKGGNKCLTGQRFICTEVASYKIHILMPIFNENTYLDEELMIAWFGFNREIFVMKS